MKDYSLSNLHSIKIEFREIFETENQDLDIRRRVLWALYHSFKWLIWRNFITRTISSILNSVIPLILKILINYVQYNSEHTVLQNIGYCIGLSVLVLIRDLCSSEYYDNSERQELLISAVLFEVLQDSELDIKKLSVAITRLITCILFVTSFVICILLLFWNIKVAALMGISVFALVSIGFSLLIKFMRNKQKKIEPELGILMLSLTNSMTTLSSLVSFLTVFKVYGLSNASDIFTSLRLYGILSQEITTMLTSLEIFLDGVDSLDRICSLLQEPNKPSLHKEQYSNFSKGLWSYFKNGATKAIIVLLVSVISISTFADAFTNTWLSFWSLDKFQNRSNAFYIGIYVLLTMISVILPALMNLILSNITTRSSQFLLKSIPIVNEVRFHVLTIGTPLTFAKMIMRLSSLVSILLLCSVFIPWFAISVPIVVSSTWIFARLFCMKSVNTRRKLGILLNLLSASLVMLVSMLSIFNVVKTNPYYLGLILNYIVEIAPALNGFIQNMSQSLANLTYPSNAYAYK